MHDSKWYVAYTFSKSEKKVHSKFKALGFESFLPLRLEKRKWSDRVKYIETPLFPGYVFVYTTKDQLMKLEKIDRVVRFVTFGDKFATIRSDEIGLIKKILSKNLDAKIDNRTLESGDIVEIKNGIFKGLQAAFVEELGKNRVIIKIGEIQQGLSIEISREMLQDIID